jgi:hypothetical protein
MLADAGRWPDRVWAVEGCEGIGKHLVLRLLDAGEQVVDVPAKLSARMRVYATGQGRKTDDTDAHSIALVAVRMSGLREVVNDETLEVLRLLVDRRRRIGEDHTRMVCQLHQLLLELVPGGAKKGPVGGPRPASSSRPSDQRTWPGRPANASPWNWWSTSSGSTPGRRPRTRSSSPWAS